MVFRVLALFVAATTLVGCAVGAGQARPAQTCDEWSRLDPASRSRTLESIVEPALMESVRSRQHMTADASNQKLLDAVRSSIDKICDLEGRPDLRLVEIIASLYR